MLNARPLFDNAADARFFVEPPGWGSLLRSIKRGLNVLVVGNRGVGKTTLLRQVQRHLREVDTAVSYVEASAVTDGYELASRVRATITGRSATIVETMITGFGGAAGRPAPPGGASRALHAELEAINAADPTIVLVDASASAAAVYGIFGRMRDLLWQGPHTWVVAIDDGDRITALRPPADAFFDVVAAQDRWDREKLTEMLRRREPTTPEKLLATIADGANGSPRAALRALAGVVVGGEQPEDRMRARAELERRADELGRPHAMLFAELIERGQASPSDTELQATLGVTRTRLAQLLGEMHKNGLVIADVAKPDGPGRPKKVFRPALAS